MAPDDDPVRKSFALLPLWEVFDTVSGLTLGYARARGADAAVLDVVTALGREDHHLDADLVPLERLDSVPAGRECPHGGL